MEEMPRRGRGRPKGTGKVDPDDIISAALDALSNGGYRGLTMRGVARSLNISLSSVQHHYPTKDDLWRAAVDHLTNDAIERRRQPDLPRLSDSIATLLEEHGSRPGLLAALPDLPSLSDSIATLLEEHGSRPGLLAALLTDTDEGSAARIAYLAKSFNTTLAGPTEDLENLEELDLIRPVDRQAFFALMTIGIGSIAGAADALKAIYGFDISTEAGRKELSDALADILALGMFNR